MDAGVLEQLLALERALLDPQTRCNPEWLERVLADEMVEFGKSGGAYDKADIIAALATEMPSPVSRFTVIDPKASELAPGVVLFTYRLEPLVEGETASRRSSIWQYRDERWQMVFHQGTATR